MYDIAIIGAGPSGATLARLLARKYKVLLIDRRQLASQEKGLFEKCCGGLIAPDAQKMLAKLGLGVPKEVLTGPQLFTVRTMDIQNDLERYYQRHYINMDREKFDRWLVSSIPSSVKILCGALFKKCSFDQGLIKIHFSHQGKEHIEKVKYLIGADGAFSTLRRQIAPDLLQKTYISIQEWFETQDSQPYFSAIFDQDISDFYSWTIPKENSLIVGTALLPKENVAAKFALLKTRLQERGFALKTSVKRNGAFILRPQKLDQIFLGRGNIAFIGEAAGWISPTSAEGLSFAFESAVALAKSLESEPEMLIEEYRKNTSELKIKILLKNMKAPFMYNSSLRKIVMKSGLLSMEIYQ
jgi:geranylgeranyl reductase